MRRIWARQSDLSLASALFYAAGGLFSLLVLTVFHHEPSPTDTVVLFITLVSPSLAIAFLIAGRRVKRVVALPLICFAATFILATVIFSPMEIRAVNSGMLFYTVLIYLVWFGPMWLARSFGYLWLAVYCIIMVARFSDEVWPLLVTLIVTAVILGELVGHFKAKLEATSLTDPLCGVWNKRAFDAMVARSVAIARRTGRPLSVMYCDLDDFKRINDTHGHLEGDRVLRGFAQAVDSSVRSQDVFFRLGGDEFALVMPETDAETAELVGARLQSEITQIGWSFGIAALRDTETAAELTARADELMLERKHDQKRQ